MKTLLEEMDVPGSTQPDTECVSNRASQRNRAVGSFTIAPIFENHFLGQINFLVKMLIPKTHFLKILTPFLDYIISLSHKTKISDISKCPNLTELLTPV